MKIEGLNYNYNNDIISKKVSTDVEEGFIVIAHNTLTGEVYEFNGVGSVIFLKLAENMEISEILLHLIDEYDVKKEDIYDDVATIIKRLLEIGVIIEGE